ncbi:MAG: DsbE family thiol:disulfide interchange protein [Robiginitomaculum sp.]
MNISLKALIPLAVFAALCIALAIGLTKDPSELQSMMIDKPFPEFSLPNLHGEGLLGNEVLEGNVTLVNVFGTWCAPCAIEHPVLMKIEQTKAVTLLGVNWMDTRENGRDWLKKHGNPYTYTLSDKHSSLVQALGVAKAPESFLVDKTGRIRYKHTGVITLKAWREVIEPLTQKLEAET